MIFSFLGLNINADIATLIIFAILLSIFLLYKRKNIETQKVIFPILYIFLYKTKFGIKFMEKFVSKHRTLVKFFGYNFIGFGFIGMIFISLTIIWSILTYIFSPAVQDTGMALVLPGFNIPGIGYLPFWYWLICLFFLALIHEFAHGVVAMAHNVKIKSSGFGILAILLPIIPAAFVEPDEKELQKKKDIAQYSVFAAGPIINLFVAFILLLAFPFVLNPSLVGPFENSFSEPVGISFDLTDEELPAAIAGMQNETFINSVNGNEIKDYQDFLVQIRYMIPGEIIEMSNENETFFVTPVLDEDTGLPLIGISNIRNERAIISGKETSAGIYYWFKGLFRWLFLLNFFVGLVNLLPIFITDGARMLQVFLASIIKDKKKAKKIWIKINAGFITLLLIGLLGPLIKTLGSYLI